METVGHRGSKTRERERRTRGAGKMDDDMTKYLLKN